jgi:hypothetical protein
MPMLFPTSPTTGQVFTSGGRSWVWTGATWDSPTATNTLLAPYGLELVKTQTIGTAVSSVTVTDAFSAKYDAYRIIVNGGATSANGLLNLQLAGVASGYYYSLSGARYDNAAYVGANVNNGSSFVGAGNHYTNEITMNVDLLNPFLTTKTWLSANQVSFSSFNSYGYGAGEVSGGSRTGFVISPASGTMTGGTIRVYGYRNA